ncbi:hypothetical protein IHE44_0001731 [Lamprotornis superbus]|uniref:Transmembrane protein 254 n=1 Tax=Lamprotornis superbus TaxID=245042 RepID=A0A835TXK9_9PASS|nr:hypothetical protein IHE44_0001731 [Lamprotornis superbus]
MVWVTLWPSTIPYSYLGLFGTFLNYLVEHHHKWVCYMFWISWLIHIVEALYGIKLCQAKGITDPGVQFQWFVQTLLFGYASFGLLVSYKPAAKKQLHSKHWQAHSQPFHWALEWLQVPETSSKFPETFAKKHERPPGVQLGVLGSGAVGDDHGTVVAAQARPGRSRARGHDDKHGDTELCGVEQPKQAAKHASAHKNTAQSKERKKKALPIQHSD